MWGSRFLSDRAALVALLLLLLPGCDLVFSIDQGSAPSADAQERDSKPIDADPLAPDGSMSVDGTALQFVDGNGLPTSLVAIDECSLIHSGGEYLATFTAMPPGGQHRQVYLAHSGDGEIFVELPHNLPLALSSDYATPRLSYTYPSEVELPDISFIELTEGVPRMRLFGALDGPGMFASTANARIAALPVVAGDQAGDVASIADSSALIFARATGSGWTLAESCYPSNTWTDCDGGDTVANLAVEAVAVTPRWSANRLTVFFAAGPSKQELDLYKASRLAPAPDPDLADGLTSTFGAPERLSLIGATAEVSEANPWLDGNRLYFSARSRAGEPLGCFYK